MYVEVPTNIQAVLCGLGAACSHWFLDERHVDYAGDPNLKRRGRDFGVAVTGNSKYKQNIAKQCEIWENEMQHMNTNLTTQY